MGSWRSPNPDIMHNAPEEAEREGNRGEQEEITVEWNMLPNWLVSHSVVGRSNRSWQVGYSYWYGTRGVEVKLNQRLKRRHFRRGSTPTAEW